MRLAQDSGTFTNTPGTNAAGFQLVVVSHCAATNRTTTSPGRQTATSHQLITPTLTGTCTQCCQQLKDLMDKHMQQRRSQQLAVWACNMHGCNGITVQ